MLDKDTPCPPDIPPHTFNAIKRHVLERKPTGGFMTAVLTNNLRDAFGCADVENLPALHNIVKYLHWEVPAMCWGSPEKVNTWLKGDE